MPVVAMNWAKPPKPIQKKGRFKSGEYAFIKTLDVTEEEYGIVEDMLVYVGTAQLIASIDKIDGALILAADGGYAVHPDDCLTVKEAEAEGYKIDINVNTAPKAPPGLTDEILFKVPSGRCHIDYLLYKPRRGEVTKRPSWATLVKREEEEYDLRHETYTTDYGWDRTRELDADEIKKKKIKPLTCWRTNNTACWAGLITAVKAFESPVFWANKPPTWLMWNVGSQMFHKWQNRAYMQLLMEHKMAPPDIDLDQYEKDDVVTFRLADYGANHLFGMLNFMRNVHEFPWLVSKTLHNHLQGFNFYVSVVMAYFVTDRHVSGHNAISNHGRQAIQDPTLVLRWARKLEQYFCVDAKEEKAYVKRRNSFSFGIQNAIERTKLDKKPPEIRSWNDLYKQKPIYL